MIKAHGFLNFNTAEDYLEHQKILICNWTRSHHYRTEKYYELYRGTGRTYSAIKCALELSKRNNVKLIIFVASTEVHKSGLKNHPLLKNTKNLHKIKFVSYERLNIYLTGQYPDYIIYDHYVFESCDPTGYLHIQPKMYHTQFKNRKIKSYFKNIISYLKNMFKNWRIEK